MRFETSKALDALEGRLTNDPLRAGAVIDFAAAARSADLDGGKPAALLRVGQFVDALSRRLGDSGAALYPVAERGMLSDTDFTSNERMVLRRWSDDGLVEMLAAGGSPAMRAGEVAALTGLPLISRVPLPAHPGVVYLAAGGAGGLELTVAPVVGSTPRPHAALGRLWRCTAPDCASFGRPPAPGAAQPPPGLPSGAPICPRHGERLQDAGPRPWLVPIAVRLGGVVRSRLTLVEGRPCAVGRAPDDPGGVALGGLLDEDGNRRISRRHVVLDARDGVVYATDVSTNGSVVLGRTNPAVASRRVTMTRDQAVALGEWDEIELYPGVVLGRADRPPATASSAPMRDSVMADAPTMAMRLPRP